MPVNFNPNLSFTSYRLSDETVNQARENAKASNNALLTEVLDKCEYVNDKKAQKEPGKFKKGIAKIAKFFTTMSEWAKGIVKGIGYGGMTAVGVLAAGWLFDAFPKGFKKGNSLKETFKHPIKVIGKPAKITAGVAAVAVGAYHIIRGLLQANQRKAFVDQKLNIQ